MSYRLFLFDNVHKDESPVVFDYVKDWMIEDKVLNILQESDKRHVVILKEGNYIEGEKRD